MTDNPLDLIEARAHAATSGPWVAKDCPPCTERGRLELNIWDAEGNFQITSWCDDDELHRPDAVFIAAARTDVEKMAKALRAVEAEIAMWRERCTTDNTGDVALRAGAYKIETAIREALG